MTAAVIGALRAELSASVAQWQADMGKAADSVKGFAAKFERIGGQLQSIGGAMSIGITAPFTALVAASYGAAREAQQAAGQVAAALQSMGDAAGRSQEQLEEQAAALMRMSTFDDDEILRKVTANLLTFGNVANEQFDRAQQAIVDLSSRMGTDLQSSALMVGKALNAPTQGLAALRRVGIQFTEQQEAQIEAMEAAGNIAGAQGIMLAELERQFGGSAKAMRDATPEAAMRNAWDDFQETVGAIAIEVLPPITAGLTAMLEAFNNLDPGVQTMVVGFGAVLAAAGPVIGAVGTMVTAFGAITSVVVPAVTAAGPVIGAALTFMTGPIGITIAAVGALVAAWVLFDDEIKAALASAWQWVRTTFAQITGAISGGMRQAVATLAAMWEGAKAAVIAAARAMVTGVTEWLVNRMRALLAPVRGLIQSVTGFFRDMYVAVVGNSYVPDMVDEIGEHIARLDALMVRPVNDATRAVIEGMRDLAREGQALLQSLMTPMERAFQQFAKDMQTLDDMLATGLITLEAYDEAVRRLKARMGEAITPVVDVGRSGDRIETRGEVPLADMPDRLPDATGRTGRGRSSPVDELEREENRMREAFGRTFADGAMAALGGRGGDWIKDWFRNMLSNAAQSAFERAGQALFDAIQQGLGSLGGGTGGAGGGIGGMIASWFGMGGGTGGASAGGSGGIMGFFQSMFSGGLRAAGGAVNPGRSYVVGEFRPERFRPNVSGTIEPTTGGPSQVFNITTPDADSFRRSQRQIARAARLGMAGV